MRLVTSEQMRQVDQFTIDTAGIPSLHLMENAGQSIAEFILTRRLSGTTNSRIAIFCGNGNNGGDGFVIARYLHEAGHSAQVFYHGPDEKLSPDSASNKKRASKIDVTITRIDSMIELPDMLDVDLIVDAIFGTGFSGAPRGLFSEWIQYINNQETEIVAVDMPSGLNSDNGTHEGEVIQADLTCTIGLPKYGLYVTPGRELSGDVETIPIGIPDRVLGNFDLPDSLTTKNHVSALIPHRPTDGHKGTFGRVLTIAGSFGMTGAAILVARSALRSGCGMVKVACPRSILPAIDSAVIESTTHPLPENRKAGSIALRALGEIRALAKDHDAIVIGPGLSQNHETMELVRRFVAEANQPMVIDADALNALAGHTEILKNVDSPVILTPHPGEFKRLCGHELPTDIHERIKLARQFAIDHKVVLVLKGSPTITMSPDGICFMNSSGNHGMATGGSGDVLSGIIGSLVAQGMDSYDSAVVGVFIHGMAGDLGAEILTPRCLIASDIIDNLPDVFALLEN